MDGYHRMMSASEVRFSADVPSLPLVARKLDTDTAVDIL
jgi:hypothetical protein